MLTAIVIPTSTIASVFTTIGDQLSDTGTLLILVAVIGIPFGFWFLKKVIGLFPKK